jgi:hypothetical protein
VGAKGSFFACLKILMIYNNFSKFDNNNDQQLISIHEENEKVKVFIFCFFIGKLLKFEEEDRFKIGRLEKYFNKGASMDTTF